jgi:DHA3 family macrolide efflux protein-like MFS transporter
VGQRLKFCLIAFATAQIISIFGDRLNQFAVIGMVGRLEPGSSVELLKLSLFTHLPILLFAPLFGALLDRWNHRWVMIIIDLLRGLIVLAIPTVFFYTTSLYAFYLPVFVLSMANLLFAPAKSAVIPELVPDNRLFQVNAVLWGVGIAATIAGILLGGWIFDYRSWEWTFYTDAGSYAFSVLLLLPLLLLPASVRRGPFAPPPAGAGPGHRLLTGLRAFLFSIRDGGVLIGQSKVIAINLVTQTAMFGVAGWLYVIGIAHLQEVFPPGRTIYLSISGAAGTAGLLAGSLIASMFRERLSFNRTIAVGTLLMGVSVIGFARTEQILHLAIWSFLMGASVSPTFILTETLLQKHIPEDFRGRVFSAREALTKSAFLASSLIAAFTDAFLTKSAILIMIGLFLALLGVVLERTKWVKL